MQQLRSISSIRSKWAFFLIAILFFGTADTFGYSLLTSFNYSNQDSTTGVTSGSFAGSMLPDSDTLTASSPNGTITAYYNYTANPDYAEFQVVTQETFSVRYGGSSESGQTNFTLDQTTPWAATMTWGWMEENYSPYWQPEPDGMYLAIYQVGINSPIAIVDDRYPDTADAGGSAASGSGSLQPGNYYYVESFVGALESNTGENGPFGDPAWQGTSSFDLTFGTTIQVPEPASSTSIISTLTLLATCMRRQQKRPLRSTLA